jgi:hypothetical protein
LYASKIIQRTKAIHNSLSSYDFPKIVVCIKDNPKNESNSQLVAITFTQINVVCIKDNPKNESNSQPTKSASGSE